MIEHLVAPSMTAAQRDRIREELYAYACGSLMLDGVGRDKHISFINNSPYQLDEPNEPRVKSQYAQEDQGQEGLFELAA